MSKIVIDINHPAHVHFFKNFWQLLRKEGHEVLITASTKDLALELLKEYKIPYSYLGSYGKTLIEKICNLPIMSLKEILITKKFKPDYFFGISSVRGAQAAWFLGKPSFIFDDTDHKKDYFLYYPFAQKVFTPNAFKKNLGPKQVRYNGYHELAYLSPKYFTPNPLIKKSLGIKNSEKYFIVRFVCFDAAHDLGKKGLPFAQKVKIINFLNKRGRVFLTSENTLPPVFEKYRLKISAGKIHHLMAYASICITEGATMASESAILGVPAIYINSLRAGTIDEQEQKFGLVYNGNNQNIYKLVDSLLKKPKSFFKQNRKKLLQKTIDVNTFLLKIIKGLDA